MDKEYLISRIGNLSQVDFSAFCKIMLQNEFQNKLEDDSGIEDVFYSYEDSGLIMPAETAQIYLISYLPYELFDDPRSIPFNNPIMRKKIKHIIEQFEKDDRLVIFRTGYPGHENYSWVNPISAFFFFTHITGPTKSFFQSHALEEYEKMIRAMGLDRRFDGLSYTIGIGYPQHFVENDPEEVINALDTVKSVNNQIAIEFSEQGYEVNTLVQGKYVTSGVTRLSGEIISPYLVEENPNRILREFQLLLNSNSSEKQIQEFLVEYHNIIFGNKYDLIKSEVCLRFPELDIAGQNRRIDILAHNSIDNDWELIELKKKVKIATSYRGIPTFTSEIYGAIAQMKNYYSLLMQDKVKELFKREGIEYYNPSLKLIVGGERNISHNQWRQMLANTGNVQLITYENLIEEMKRRYAIQ